MKKGNIEVKEFGEKAHFFGGRYVTYTDKTGVSFSKQDLRDLRDCIDEVLGEECAVCDPTWEGKQPIPLCEKHDKEILCQPLKEDEGECCEECLCYGTKDEDDKGSYFVGCSHHEGWCHNPKCPCHQEKETEKYLHGTEEQAERLKQIGATDGVVHDFQETPKKLPSEEKEMKEEFIHELLSNLASGVLFNARYHFKGNQTEIEMYKNVDKQIKKYMKFYLDETAKEKTVGCKNCGHNFKV